MTTWSTSTPTLTPTGPNTPISTCTRRGWRKRTVTPTLSADSTRAARQNCRFAGCIVVRLGHHRAVVLGVATLVDRRQVARRSLHQRGVERDSPAGAVQACTRPRVLTESARHHGE